MRLFEKLDELNKTLLGLAVVLLLAAFVAGGNQTLTLVFRLLFALCVLLAVYRIFGGRPDKRNQENMVFLRMVTEIRDFFRNLSQKRGAAGGTLKQKLRERREYRYLTCTQCGQKLRVPRGKGRIRVTCTKCRNQFLAKS